MKLIREDVRYPQKGDKLFIEKGNQDEIAWLQKAFQDFGSYADSYQVGALNLLELALENREYRDYHAYPAIFLIRHYIELRLKELIQGLKYCENQDKISPPGHHKLGDLWKIFLIAYKTIGENIDDERFLAIEELIDEIIFNDPFSMAFRYPVDLKGTKTQKLEYINLSNLKETFIRMCFVFDGVAMQIANYVEMTEDMMRDAYGEYY